MRMFSRLMLLAGMLLMPLMASAQLQMPDFRKCFKVLEGNAIVYRTYNDSIHAMLSDTEWVAMMERRANTFRIMHFQNNRATDIMMNYFNYDKTSIPDEAYDSLFVCVEDAFNHNVLDNFFIDMIAEVLMPYYMQKGSLIQQVKLRHIVGLCNTEISRFLDQEAGNKAKSLFTENLKLAEGADSLPPGVLRVLPLDFMNYSYTLAALGFVSPSEALDATNRFENFVKQYRHTQTEADAMRWDLFLQRVRTRSAQIHQAPKLETATDSMALVQMLKYSPYSHMTEADLATSEDSIFYYQQKVYAEEMEVPRADSLIYHIARRLLSEVEHQDTISEFDIQMLGNVLSISLTLMDANPIHPKEELQRRTVSLTSRLADIVQRVQIVRDPFFFESMLGHLACMPIIFHNLPTDKKIDFMNEIAVKSQIGTVVHVGAVDTLAVVVFDGLVDKCPEQFVGVLGLYSVQDVLANKDMLRKWVGTAAAYHDLGKIGMSPIFNDDFRRLTQREFELSRLHPELAMRYLGVDTVFSQFKDVALGHHKWYNGKGGYPASFDNTQSPWRSYIDLVTICDCIDAATDNINRNYRTPKNLKEVLVEFRHDAGRLYNPVMVEALCNDKQLCDRIERVITEHRADLLRGVRDRYLK